MAAAVPQNSLIILFSFAVALLALVFLSRQVALHTQIVVQLLTRSSDAGMLTYFLLFLPGIILHEGSHWITAWLLRLKPSKFRVWPQRRGKYLVLGSVTTRSGGIWRDSIVGAAPLLVGIPVAGWIGWNMLATSALSNALLDGRLLDVVGAFVGALTRPDGPFWAYLLFAIANSMMPSRSDREPLKPVLLYLAFFSLVYVVVGLPLDPFTELVAWLVPALQVVVGALAFVILVDLILLGVLWLVERPLRRRLQQAR
jgi:hypothetical protein